MRKKINLEGSRITDIETEIAVYMGHWKRGEENPQLIPEYKIGKYKGRNVYKVEDRLYQLDPDSWVFNTEYHWYLEEASDNCYKQFNLQRPKIFSTFKSENEDMEIEITEDYVCLIKYFIKPCNNNWNDIYYFEPRGIIEKYECNSDWARNTGTAGGGLTSHISIWKKRLGWEKTKEKLSEAESFDEALEIVNERIDSSNIFSENNSKEII